MRLHSDRRRTTRSLGVEFLEFRLLLSGTNDPAESAAAMAVPFDGLAHHGATTSSPLLVPGMQGDSQPLLSPLQIQGPSALVFATSPGSLAPWSVQTPSVTPVQLSVHVTDGYLRMSTLPSGLQLTGDTNRDVLFTLRGPVALVNVALSGMTWHPPSDSGSGSPLFLSVYDGAGPPRHEDVVSRQIVLSY